MLYSQLLSVIANVSLWSSGSHYIRLALYSGCCLWFPWAISVPNLGEAQTLRVQCLDPGRGSIFWERGQPAPPPWTSSGRAPSPEGNPSYRLNGGRPVSGLAVSVSRVCKGRFFSALSILAGNFNTSSLRMFCRLLVKFYF